MILVERGGGVAPMAPIGSSSAPLVAAVRAALQAHRDRVRLVVGVAGPGSYMGVRSGLAAALGAAQSLGCPLALASSLEVIAAQVEPTGGTALALADAGRGGTFGQVMGPGPQESKPMRWSPLGPAQLLARDLAWPAPWAALSAVVGSPGTGRALPAGAAALTPIRDRRLALAWVAASGRAPLPGYDPLTAEYAAPVGAW